MLFRSWPEWFSPAKTIRAISTVGKTSLAIADPGEELTAAVLDWNWQHWGNSTAPFVRVEVVDANGRMAWSQAVFPR